MTQPTNEMFMVAGGPPHRGECATCIHWGGLAVLLEKYGDEAVGECKANPPQPLYTGPPGRWTDEPRDGGKWEHEEWSGSVIALWPRTGADDWCSHWLRTDDRKMISAWEE